MQPQVFVASTEVQALGSSHYGITSLPHIRSAQRAWDDGQHISQRICRHVIMHGGLFSSHKLSRNCLRILAEQTSCLVTSFGYSRYNAPSSETMQSIGEVLALEAVSDTTRLNCCSSLRGAFHSKNIHFGHPASGIFRKL